MIICDLSPDRFKKVFSLYVLFGQFFIVKIGFDTDVIKAYDHNGPEKEKDQENKLISHKITTTNISTIREYNKISSKTIL